MLDANEIWTWATDLFPINRSLTGEGNRETLKYISKIVPIQMRSMNSGSICFDWTIPDEWNVKEAYIVTPDGRKICDFRKNNLYLLGYSEPMERILSLKELKEHLYTDKSNPEAIPYRTSYYERNWGFCIEYNNFRLLTEGDYRVKIDSTIKPGKMDYGELYIPGKSKKEIIISTYICHPSMGNNELSGPILTTMLARHLLDLEHDHTLRNYSYRFVYGPETIGAICYIYKNYDHLMRNTIAGYVVTCVGDTRSYSLLKGKMKNLSEIAAKEAFKIKGIAYKEYSFFERGSDERQYCGPGINLPFASIMRTKYGAYKEYHSSLDNLNFISPEGLMGAFEVYIESLRLINLAIYAEPVYKCEPMMSKRGLRSALSGSKEVLFDKDMFNILTFITKDFSSLEVADATGINHEKVLEYIYELKNLGLLKLC